MAREQADGIAYQTRRTHDRTKPRKSLKVILRALAPTAVLVVGLIAWFYYKG